PEELVERIVLVEPFGHRKLRHLSAGSARPLGGADVHHRGPGLLDQAGEVGKLPNRLCERLRGHPDPGQQAGGHDPGKQDSLHRHLMAWGSELPMYSSSEVGALAAGFKPIAHWPQPRFRDRASTTSPAGGASAADRN